MEMALKKLIVGIHVGDRFEHSKELQSVLTENGKIIKTRLGLHNPSRDKSGLILLELVGTEEERKKFVEEIKKIPEIDVQSMRFTH